MMKTCVKFPGSFVSNCFIFLGFCLVLPPSALAEAIKAKTSSDKSDFEAKMTQTTSEEMNAIKSDLKKQLAGAQDKLGNLKKAREKFAQDSSARASAEEKGISFFKQYAEVIRFKYLDKDGAFDPKAELSPKDVATINSIFNNYLHGQPLQGKITTTMAMEQITQGVTQVQQLIGIHAKPEVTNSSELAILVKDEESAQKRVTVLQDLVAKIEAPANSDTRVEQRMPASESK